LIGHGPRACAKFLIMKAVIEIYRRYFKRHVVGLMLASLCFLAFALEGSIMAGISRYLIDEVLQVDLMLKMVTAGQRGPFVAVDEPLPDLPREQPVLTGDLTDGKLPGEDISEPIFLTDLPVEGSLEDRIAAKPGRPTAEKLKFLALIAMCLVTMHLTTVGARAWANVKMGRITEQVVFTMRRHIHDKLLRLQMSFYDQHQTGRLLSRAIDDVQVVENNFASILTEWARFLGIIVINISLMFYISPKLACFALVTVPFYAYAYNVLGGKIRTLSKNYRKSYGALYGLVRDRLANPRVIKGFGQEKRELVNFYRRAVGLFRYSRRIVVLNNVLAMICTCISVVMTAITLGYGVVLLQRGELTLGYLLFFYTVANGLFTPVASLSQLMASMQSLRVSCERILEVLNEPVRISDHPRAVELSRFKDAITFENVTLEYEGSERPAVDDINLTVPKGARVCLMGSSGAGKSTLGMLLLRLYDADKGTIRIDGIDLRKIKIGSLRRRISYVPQEPLLFSGTLASNILYGDPGAGRKQMIAAAKAAEIHEFIADLPDGYDTLIGENGLRLSGGQKQRISLARALLTDPDILVLDDCTSALDAETEAKIQQTLKNALADKTVIIISHRVSVASNADVVVVLDRGKIVEQGTHQELLDRQGQYWNLIKDQLEERTAIAITQKRLAAPAA